MPDETPEEEHALATMRALIGKPLGAPTVAPDPVNQPMIRHWAAALEGPARAADRGAARRVMSVMPPRRQAVA